MHPLDGKLPAMIETPPGEPAAFYRRLLAMLYDTFLVLPIIMATVALFMGLRGFVFDATGDDTQAAALDANLVRLIILINLVVFFSIFWLKSGQTLGMQAWRIKLVSFSGSAVTPGQAVTRCLGAALSIACLGAGYWWCLFDPKRRYWHDYLSKSELILVPKKN